MSEEATTTAPSEGPPAPDAPASSGEPPPAAPEHVVLKVAPPAAPAPEYRPNYVFLAVVSLASLGLDLGSKAWAKQRLEEVTSFVDRRIEVVADHLAFTFAKNRGGAWGLLQDEPESIRRPFFLAISVLAIGFIVSLYRKLTPNQWALKWGLPLVLGGALGNLVNRIQYNYVVDFIDYRAGWVRRLNGLLSPHPNDHWPTFNIADVAIVAGVVLMAVDMFTPAPKKVTPPPPATATEPAKAAEPAASSTDATTALGAAPASPGDATPEDAPKPQAPAET